MPDGGSLTLPPEDEDAFPERTCIATRTVREPHELIRFVAGPDGSVVPDLKRKLPGRGAWVSARREAVALAVRRGAFARALKREGLRAAPDLPDLVERLLAADAVQSLSLANKAGRVVTGFEKVEAAILSGGALAVLHAREAAPDGRRKLGQAARRRAAGETEPIAALSPLSGAEMEMALGRHHVVHAALAPGSVSLACLSRCRALIAYRGGDAGEADHDSPEHDENAQHGSGTSPQDT